jgi:hypothetical protein
MRPKTIYRALLLPVVLGAFGTQAGQIVSFEDGRTMRVQRIEPQGQALRLHLEEGGMIDVPAWRITDWHELSEPEPLIAARPESEADQPWRRLAGAYTEPIELAARSHRLDPVLLTAMAQVESAFGPTAVSPKGAQGLLQLMPATAARFGVKDAFDASQNIDGGARYLSWLLQRYDGRTELALAGYNAGEAAVDRYSAIPPFRETRDYVDKVLAHARRLRGPGVEHSGPVVARGGALGAPSAALASP